MDINNLGICEQNCNKKCYIYLKDGTLVRKLCKEVLCKVFNNCDEIINREIKKHNISIEEFNKYKRYKDWMLWW